MDAKWNIRRGFIKMHVMVDSITKKIYAVSITNDKAGDVPEFKKLLDEALQNIKKSPNVVPSDELCVGADGHMISMIILINIKSIMSYQQFPSERIFQARQMEALQEKSKNLFSLVIVK